ncbi:FAD-dependent oxidoreductase [Georgenia satyanarayanai]|uniref:FAD-dependent oxidoreductase n=1 Tax=Georgenia satyanarayanai TaxID=860221 RepID=UPI001C64CBA9|nr:FAD-dependent oxidoreductase [Georgenia satyanarayanai]
MAAERGVVVVGAGPTGLMVAAELATAGVPVTLVDRRRPGNPNVTRAFAVHAATLELFDMRGLADALVGTGAQVRQLQLFDTVRVDLGRLPSRYGYLLVTPQSQTERVLRDRVDSLGVAVELGVDVTGLSQDGDGVTVAGRREDGSAVELRGSVVVGADGAGSTVRRELGLPFPGRSVLRSIMLADVRLTAPPRQVLTVNAVGDGFAFVAPFGDGWYRVFAWDRRRQVGDDAPVDLEEIREVMVRALGSDLGMHSPRWLSRFHSDERQSPSYRRGRVILAGDAAHVHSPAGGQGMNTGLQDAANLGWKLAAVLNGRASEALLDTYQGERHPVGATVLRTSGALIRMAMMRSPVARRVRNGLAGVAAGFPPVADRAARTVSGIGVRYAAPAGADRRVGSRAGDLALADGRLHERLRAGQFVLVADREPADVPEHVVWAAPASPVGEPVLVRPDGYVGWVGDVADYPYWP